MHCIILNFIWVNYTHVHFDLDTDTYIANNFWGFKVFHLILNLSLTCKWLAKHRCLLMLLLFQKKECAISFCRHVQSIHFLWNGGCRSQFSMMNNTHYDALHMMQERFQLSYFPLPLNCFPLLTCCGIIITIIFLW